MNKTDFLKEAQGKLKNQLEVKNKWIAEMNFIFDENTVLRVWFEPFKDGVRKNKTGEYMHRWSTVDTLPSQSNDKIANELGRFVANDSDDFSAIIKALRRELKKKSDGLIDHVQFGKDEDDTITPIEKLEFTFTVKDFCNLIGIEG